jgi:hypothetical protein
MLAREQFGQFDFGGGVGWVARWGCIGVGTAIIHSIGDYSNPLGESSGGVVWKFHSHILGRCLREG